MPGTSRMTDDDLRSQVADIHRAIVGTVDGSSPGIHRRLDGFESVVKDHEERITDAEETLATHNRIREERAATLAAHDHRITRNTEDIQALKDAKGQGLDRWWAIAMAVAGAVIGQTVGAMWSLMSAAFHAPVKPH